MLFEELEVSRVWSVPAPHLERVLLGQSAA